MIMDWIEKRNNLLIERMKLDRFFTLFLDKFERKMDPDNTDTPVWKLYKQKLKEYDKVQHDIKSAEYWISKQYV
jgi:hypothetical protein